jgi:hypothetical protein
MKHLISFLGRGDYQPVRYRYGNETCRNHTPYIVFAASKLLNIDPSAGCITVFVTDRVTEHWTALRTKLEGEGWVLNTNLFAVVVSPPATSEALWETYQRLEQVALQGDHAEVVVDITHGYRALAALAIVAMNGALSARSRQRQSVPRIRYIYGALEAVEYDSETPVPIWDLSDFARAAQWNDALTAFLRHGRADSFAALSRDAALEGPTQASLEGVGLKLQDLSDDLCCLRPRAIDGSAAALARHLDEACEAITKELPILSPALSEIADLSGRLSAARPFDKGWVMAVLELVRFYQRVDRFAEAYVVMRETWGVLFDPRAATALVDRGTPSEQVMKTMDDRLMRLKRLLEDKEGRLRSAELAQLTARQRKYLGSYSTLVEFRNSLMHWKFPWITAENIRKKMKGLIAAYETAATSCIGEARQARTGQSQ